MKYILDTDICIYWLNGDRGIEEKILSVSLKNIAITVITECELYYGAHKSSRVEQNLKTLEALRNRVGTIHTSRDIAPIYGEIKAELERQGERLDDADLLIASIVLKSKGTLVTHHINHFQRISSLKIENWRSA